MEIINDLNLKRQAKSLGVSVWQTPSFLFIMMGVVAISVMTATYYLSKNYDDPSILIISESIVVVIILIVGTSVIRLVDQIARVNKMKSEFVSVASHQLRTPVSAIRWETEILLTPKSRKGLSEKQIKNIESISLLSARMARLVNDLLDVTKIDQRRLVLKKSLVSLVEIVDGVILEASPLIKSRHVEVEFNANKNVPSITCDPDKMKMVIENLVNNAIKYTKNQGKVEIKIVKKNSAVVFSVKDNGVGIPDEQQNRIFDKFFRSDNAVRYQTDGTGLGLYIAKSIVNQSGGRIWFHSVENLGSVFNFSLPIK
jgi:signal transduction histidine kinase